MCQLLRSVAASTRDMQQSDLLLGSVGGVAQLLMRDHWRDRGMMGKERVGHQSVGREHTRHKLGHKTLKSLTLKSLTRKKEHTRHRTRRQKNTPAET